MTSRDPRHRIGLHHSNHLIDVMDTWPATRRRRFPFGLRRDPLLGWVVSEKAWNTWKWVSPPPDLDLYDWLREWDDHQDRIWGNLKATQYAEYRIKRGYVSPLSKEERERRRG